MDEFVSVLSLYAIRERATLSITHVPWKAHSLQVASICVCLLTRLEVVYA